MAAVSYASSLVRLLQHEGGYTNHPKDPGGPTNYGITIADYRKYIKSDATAEDVRDMKLSDAKAIYRSKYWAALRCDELPAGVDDVVFDYGVNSGIGRSGKVLRRCLDLSDNDWQVTPQVLAATQGVNPKQLIADICDERMRFLRGLSIWPTFGRGWTARVKELREFDLALVDGVAAPTRPQPKSAGPGKAKHAIPDGARPVTAGGLATIGAFIAQRLHDLGHHPGVVIVVIAGTALVIALGVAAWNVWIKRKQEAPA